LEGRCRYAGLRQMELHDMPVIDGTPRILATLAGIADNGRR
jgi:hypothetical protein